MLFDFPVLRVKLFVRESFAQVLDLPTSFSVEECDLKGTRHFIKTSVDEEEVTKSFRFFLFKDNKIIFSYNFNFS